VQIISHILKDDSKQTTHWLVNRCQIQGWQWDFLKKNI